MSKAVSLLVLAMMAGLSGCATTGVPAFFSTPYTRAMYSPECQAMKNSFDIHDPNWDACQKVKDREGLSAYLEKTADSAPKFYYIYTDHGTTSVMVDGNRAYVSSP